MPDLLDYMQTNPREVVRQLIAKLGIRGVLKVLADLCSERKKRKYDDVAEVLREIIHVTRF